jgi:hypothetical protein
MCLRWGKFCDVAFTLFTFSKITETNSVIPIYSLSFHWSCQWMWTIWRIKCQIIQSLVSCRICAITSTYLRPNIVQKVLSTINIISQNCRTSHLSPPNDNAIHTVIQSVQSVSARLLIYCKLLYRQRRAKNWVSLIFLNICACTSNTFCEHRTLWSTIQVCVA